jgi:hypothetical protein
LEEAQIVLGKCSESSVLGKVIEITERMSPHLKRFHEERVITRLKTGS